MNVLIVDDQKAIVDSLKNGINWKKLDIDQVYTACSAKEAKLILVNFQIDIMISDIEMPEEDGLELFKWTKERFGDSVEGIFLTSHAEFSYAKESIKLGGFDYILQPARYTDVEETIGRACDKLKQKQKIKKLENTSKLIVNQRDYIFDSLVSKIAAGQYQEAETIFGQFYKLFGTEYETAVFYPFFVNIVPDNRITKMWSEELLKLVFRNVMEELLSDINGKICTTYHEKYGYVVLLVVNQHMISPERWRREMESFYTFLDKQMDFKIAVYPGEKVTDAITDTFLWRQNTSSYNKSYYKAGIFWEEKTEGTKEVSSINDENRIQEAIEYMKLNLNKNITRSEVTNLVCLNEEYFSRLFKKETGYTFKDYEQMLRMNLAKELLKNTRLSISIIASKAGYDNFSHFSKMFKKMTDMTPQEYRKSNQNQ